MPLVQLVYVSQEAEDLGLADYRDIVRTAERNNRRDELTGLLVRAKPFFIQCLEGRRSQVSGLLERLYRDPRHRGVQLVHLREIDAREFTDWDMRLVRTDELDSEAFRRACLRHGIERPFRLADVSGDRLYNWLREVHRLCGRTAELPPNAADSPTLTG